MALVNDLSQDKITTQLFIILFTNGCITNFIMCLLSRTTIPFFGIFLWTVIWDGVISILFICGFFKAHKICESMHGQISNKWMSNIIKYIILTVIGSVTTFVILLELVINSWISGVAIDSIINCWCIFLMYNHNQKLFDFICCGCRQCIGNCIYFCVECNRDTKKDGLSADATMKM